MTCPQCGAAVKEGKFCNYCGAKLPDDTKRTEVRIENVAEMTRADYETKESEIRQKMEIRKYKAVTVKRRSTLILLGILVLISIYCFVFDPNENVPGALLGTIGSVFLVLWILYQLITGKW